MSHRLLAVVGVLLIVVGILATSSFFIVDQTEQALVLQLGEVRRVVREPGLWVKRPFIENVIDYDKRVLDYEPPPEEVIVSDQKRLVADTYTRYRIADPLLFYQSVGSEAGVRARLSALVSGSLRRVLGNVTLSDVLSEKRAGIMRQIRDEVAEQAKAFGIDVVDVRLRHADLPEENSQAVYARMQSEREQQARQYRGEGAEAAQTVRANAERERTVILAEAQRDAQRVRGDGDAQAVRIYADAFGQDKEFFAFYRSLQAYRDALNGRDTSFVLSPEGNFFRFFDGWTGTPAPPAASRSGTPPAPGPSSASPPAAAQGAPATSAGAARPQ
jgi:modulator of FtsH protease HflC